MMTDKTLDTVLLPAGYIAHGDEDIIWGVGATEAAAAEDAVRQAWNAGCRLDWAGIYFTPATAALLIEVARSGGTVQWRSSQVAGRCVADVLP